MGVAPMDETATPVTGSKLSILVLVSELFPMGEASIPTVLLPLAGGLFLYERGLAPLPLFSCRSPMGVAHTCALPVYVGIGAGLSPMGVACTGGLVPKRAGDLDAGQLGFDFWASFGGFGGGWRVRIEAPDRAGTVHRAGLVRRWMWPRKTGKSARPKRVTRRWRCHIRGRRQGRVGCPLETKPCAWRCERGLCKGGLAGLAGFGFQVKGKPTQH